MTLSTVLTDIRFVD